MSFILISGQESVFTENQFVCDWILQVRQKRSSSDGMFCVRPVTVNGFLSVLRGADLYMNWDKLEGRPFAYFTFGVCCCEVELDCLTGDYRVRADAFQQSQVLRIFKECLFVCLFVCCRH